MAWIKVEASVRTHEKFLAAGPAACWLWLCGLAYCQEGLTDGFIPFAALPHLGVRTPTAHKERLVSVGLWHEVSGGWSVHQYLKHNRSSATVKVIQEERRGAGTLGGRASWEARRKQVTEVNQKQVAEANPKQVAEAKAEAVAEPISVQLRSSTETATATAVVPPARRTTTLVTPPIQHRNVARFSPLGDVPRFVHDELVRKVCNGGVDEVEAEKQVTAFYAETEKQFAGQIVGDEPPKFWRAQFAAQAKQTKAISDAASLVFHTLGVKP